MKEQNKKILILGDSGMLGNAVLNFIAEETNMTPITIKSRYPSSHFERDIREISPDYIINCIGIIPQRKPNDEEYKRINTDLPIFLDSLGIKIIHPSTDCEFKGNIPAEQSYKSSDNMDADDLYGKSKAEATKYILTQGKNTKILRTSIIGHESNSNVSLLDWFLSQEKTTRGYKNHYWNGITTLEWAKQANLLINDWNKYKTITQIGTKEIHSKYDILCIIKNVYSKDINIEEFETENNVNKTLIPDIFAKPLEEQLIELKKFYKK